MSFTHTVHYFFLQLWCMCVNSLKRKWWTNFDFFWIKSRVKVLVSHILTRRKNNHYTARFHVQTFQIFPHQIYWPECICSSQYIYFIKLNMQYINKFFMRNFKKDRYLQTLFLDYYPVSNLHCVEFKMQASEWKPFFLFPPFIFIVIFLSYVFAWHLL